MDNQKDLKIENHIAASMNVVLGEMFLKPDEIAVLDELSNLHVLTEDMVTDMYNQYEREKDETLFKR